MKFYYNSRGSLFETIFWTDRLQRRNLISPEHSHKMQQYTSEEKIKLNKFINSIKSILKQPT